MNDHQGSDRLVRYAGALTRKASTVSAERVKDLERLSGVVIRSVKDTGRARIIFICTHNSRRSQLAQVWLQYWTGSYGISGVSAFSGGTETTAFNTRMVLALERAGFAFEQSGDPWNPHYRMTSPNLGRESLFFSKRYDDPANPRENFIAVMVCGQADADCPFIPGAYGRSALPYEDPKAYDGTDREAEAYDRKVLEIGVEMQILAGLLKDRMT